MFAICKDCDRALEDCDWNGESDLCDRCKERDQAVTWIEETVSAVERLADKHGWDVEDVCFARETKSRYLTLCRDERTIKVRVSDHATAYCSEDVSLAMDGGPDDATIEVLERAMQ